MAGKKLEGKVTIVTGAGSSGPGWGTGKAMSVLFAREGALVALIDMYEERAAETLAIIESDGGKAFVIATDLTDPDNCQRAVDETISRYGGVDVLINNVAVPLSKSILDTTREDFDRVLATNTSAPFWMSKAVLPSMIERGGGSIVNVTSVMALRGQGGNGCAAYATSKAALLGLTTDLTDSFGPRNIRVNTIAPGIIATPQRDNAVRAGGRDPSTFKLEHKTALLREGDAWDIANAALFLCSPEGAYITGVLLPVDGGVVARSH
jgi:NAD(P)-dependent dehydrogenase (short-subunit alcohol dehydrogenase family)